MLLQNTQRLGVFVPHCSLIPQGLRPLAQVGGIHVLPQHGQGLAMHIAFTVCHLGYERDGGLFFDLGEQGSSLSAETLGCGGGKFYTGFAPMPERVPNFVSLTEHYKATPDLVREGIAAMDVQPAPAPWLNFARIDSLSSFGGVEGLLFLATPDILSGLAAWAYFDNNDPSAVSAPFGSGCSATLTAALAENRRGGRRAFIGLFDPSVRKHLPAGVLGFAVPMSRFREMCAAMRSTCLFGTPAWSAIRARIAASGD